MTFLYNNSSLALFLKIFYVVTATKSPNKGQDLHVCRRAEGYKVSLTVIMMTAGYIPSSLFNFDKNEIKIK